MLRTSKPLLTSKGQHHRQVRAAIFRRVAELVESKSLTHAEAKSLTVGQLFRTARLLLKGNMSGTTLKAFSTVMDTLGKSINVMTPTYAYQLADVTLSGAFLNDIVLLRLEDFVSRESQQPDLPLLLHIARAMTAVGYELADPVRFGEVAAGVALKACSTSVDKNGYSAALSTLRLANCLATLNCFPKDLLLKVFSIEFLGEIDQLLADTPLNTSEHGDSHKHRQNQQRDNGSLHSHIRETLMRLNRAVVLEAGLSDSFGGPWVDSIPWFHGKHHCSWEFYEGRMKGNATFREWNFKEHVRSNMERVVGERVDYFLLTDQMTPFYHWIDFEFMPVGSDLPNDVATQNSVCSPIAVLLLSYRQFIHCDQSSSSATNSGLKLRGSVKQVIRQLQILGYRVVTINPSEWPTNQSEEAQLDMLRKLLFQNS